MGTRSIWHRVPERCGVCVIGGGIAGLSGAIELHERGEDFLLLERGLLGQGASTRNAGYLMRGAADNYASAVRAYGRARARELWRDSEENLRLLREMGIERVPGYGRRASCLAALDERELEELRSSRALLVEDGFGVHWADGAGDTLFVSGRVLGGLINPDDAVCDSSAVIRWLGSMVFERVRQGCEVRSIVLDGSGVRVGTGLGDILCDRVLVCTNAHARGLVDVPVEPRRGQMLALRAPEVRLEFSYYLNHGHEYIRQGPGQTVLVGGMRGRFAKDEVGEEDATSEQVQRALEDFAVEMLGGRYEVIGRWAGIMGFSADGLPIAGPVEGFEDRVWFCGGFTGHGMSLGHVTARRTVRAMLGV